VSKNRATLKELDEDYSVEDLMTILEIIDLESAVESAAAKDAEAQQPKGR